ncbi:hypothetical protein KC851_00370 [Candidatus Kaiserbacteria bacterium]|nr:hypothetical protein [Candidatus Kaiserbacteria bacterium]
MEIRVDLVSINPRTERHKEFVFEFLDFSFTVNFQDCKYTVLCTCPRLEEDYTEELEELVRIAARSNVIKLSDLLFLINTIEVRTDWEMDPYITMLITKEPAFMMT